ncbi:MAG: ankyrin repeat domain-containing protein [Bacteroidia bacterium]|nr:ankyrin repeat domain-containing protein [Bacteroidia bacterium]
MTGKLIPLILTTLFSFLFVSNAICGSDGETDDEKMITSAAKGEYDKVVQFVEKKGVSVNAKNKARWTALAYASKDNHVDTVNYLITKGADVNKKINTGETALQVALKRGNEDIADILLENGADVNMKDIVGMTSLAWAAKDGNMSMVKYLVEHKADINAQNPSGRTPYEITISEDVKTYLRSKGGKTGQELMYGK